MFILPRRKRVWYVLLSTLRQRMSVHARRRKLGNARVPRAGFGVAPKQSFLEFTTFRSCRRKEKFVIAGTRSPARGTRALPRLGGRKLVDSRYTAFWKNAFSKVGWNGAGSVSPIRNCRVISNCVAQWISRSTLPYFDSDARTVSSASSGLLQSRLRCPSTTRSIFPGNNSSITPAADGFDRLPCRD